MDIFFLAAGTVFAVVSLVLFLINREKKSVKISNMCVVSVCVCSILVSCYIFDVAKLFKTEYTSSYIPVTKPTEFYTYGGRPVKKDSTSTTNKPKETEQTSDHSYNGKVYITRNGKKYHYSYTCGGNEYYECTLEQALERNLEPCKKCTL